jgi:hypothetical protein
VSLKAPVEVLPLINRRIIIVWEAATEIKDSSNKHDINCRLYLLYGTCLVQIFFHRFTLVEVLSLSISILKAYHSANESSFCTGP